MNSMAPFTAKGSLTHNTYQSDTRSPKLQAASHTHQSVGLSWHDVFLTRTCVHRAWENIPCPDMITWSQHGETQPLAVLT